jgi:hypothetical protein
MNGLLNYTPPVNYIPSRWIAVQQRFEEFHRNLALTPSQHSDGHTKRHGVVSCLNRAYYGTNSEIDNSFFVGSWAKNTAIRPPRDVDVYFVLPPAVYNRFQGYAWARQSALLQEVKNNLAATFPNTEMRGDGQVVMVNFGSYNVEVVPAFLLTTGHYWICNTANGGTYKETAPWAEVNHLSSVDTANGGNLLPLIRMLKAWQATCSVPLKSFQIELIAADFIQQSPWRFRNFFWFDWIVRDFLVYLYSRANSFVFVPGTSEAIWLGDDWKSRTQTAYSRAVKACEYEDLNMVELAGEEWQKIFGINIPRTV